MKKVLSLLFVALILSALLITPFYAAEKGAKVVDVNGYLTAEQKSSLTTKLTQTGDKYDMDIVIVLIQSLNGKDRQDYADDYYDYNGYKNDGCLLLLSIEDRQWQISTKGYGITAFTDYGIDYIGSELKEDLRDEDYYEACDKFADFADDFIKEAKNGKPYDTNHTRKTLFDYVFGIGVSFGIGLIIAIIVTLTIKSKYKPVRLKAEANDYLKKDSLVLNKSHDNFLYTHVTRTRRKSDSGGGSSTHTSSSGSTHGGGGGGW